LRKEVFEVATVLLNIKNAIFEGYFSNKINVCFYLRGPKVVWMVNYTSELLMQVILSTFERFSVFLHALFAEVKAISDHDVGDLCPCILLIVIKRQYGNTTIRN
jgi:hypothetical protein